MRFSHGDKLRAAALGVLVGDSEQTDATDWRARYVELRCITHEHERRIEALREEIQYSIRCRALLFGLLAASIMLNIMVAFAVGW